MLPLYCHNHSDWKFYSFASQDADNTCLNVNFTSANQIVYFLQAKHAMHIVVPLQLDMMCPNNISINLS